MRPPAIVLGLALSISATMSAIFAAGPASAQAKSVSPQAAAFNGVWQLRSPQAALRTVDGQIPPMRPEARGRYDKAVAARRSGDRRFDPVAACQPPGIPRIFLTGRPFEILVGPSQLVMTFEWNRLFRIVDMNIDHEQQNIYGETFFGWSTGKWDRGELRVDTVSVLDTTLLDDAGIPHSIDLRQTERWSLGPDGKRLTLQIMFEDPQTFTAPWSARLEFDRLPAGTVISEDVCVERTGMIKSQP